MPEPFHYSPKKPCIPKESLPPSLSLSKPLGTTTLHFVSVGLCLLGIVVNRIIQRVAFRFLASFPYRNVFKGCPCGSRLPDFFFMAEKYSTVCVPPRYAHSVISCWTLRLFLVLGSYKSYCREYSCTCICGRRCFLGSLLRSEIVGLRGSPMFGSEELPPVS